MEFLRLNIPALLERRAKWAAIIIRLDRASVMGRVLALYRWCIEHAPDGDLRSVSRDTLAAVLDVHPTLLDAFVSALITVHIIEMEPWLRIANWWQIASDELTHRYKNNPDLLRRVCGMYTPRHLQVVPMGVKRPPHRLYKTYTERVIEYLNEKTGKQYSKDSKQLRDLIYRLLSLRYTPRDIMLVIAHQHKKYAGTKLEKALRPKRLFDLTAFRRAYEEVVKTVSIRGTTQVYLTDDAGDSMGEVQKVPPGVDGTGTEGRRLPGLHGGDKTEEEPSPRGDTPDDGGRAGGDGDIAARGRTQGQADNLPKMLP